MTSISPPPWLLHPNRRCCSAHSGWAGGGGGVLTFLSMSEQVLHLETAHLCVLERTPCCPGFMNREAGQRTEKSQYLCSGFRRRQGPAEPQIRASCPSPASPELRGGLLGVGTASGQWCPLPVSCRSFSQHHLRSPPKSEWRHRSRAVPAPLANSTLMYPSETFFFIIEV